MTTPAADFATETLPPLYAQWVDEFLGPIPAETEAPCQACVMCPSADEVATPLDHYFNPATKCCTFTPLLPNFLVGRILNDDDPAAAAGRDSVVARIQSQVSVSPLGLDRSPVYVMLYENNHQAFGHSRTLRCPHYLEEEGGRCGIWRHRAAVCATWFCKYVRGAVGLRFWRNLDQLLRAVERELARWSLLQLEIDSQVLQQLFPVDTKPTSQKQPNAHDLDGTVDRAAYQALWGPWLGREQEFFRHCARLVNPLTWPQVVQICGPEVQVQLQLARTAYTQLLATDLPPVLQPGQFTLFPTSADSCRVSTYSLYDPIDLPQLLVNVLHHFDGRTTSAVLQTILDEEEIALEETLVRKLVDFDILRSVHV